METTVAWTLLCLASAGAFLSFVPQFLWKRLLVWRDRRTELRWMERPVLDDVAFEKLMHGLAQTSKAYGHDPSKFCLLLMEKVLDGKHRFSALQLEAAKEHLLGINEKERFLQQHHYDACLLELVEEHRDRLLDDVTKG